MGYIEVMDEKELFEAVAEFIESKGGKVVVAGPVGILKEPKKFKFSVVIPCMGREPDFSIDEEPPYFSPK